MEREQRVVRIVRRDRQSLRGLGEAQDWQEAIPRGSAIAHSSKARRACPERDRRRPTPRLLDFLAESRIAIA